MGVNRNLSPDEFGEGDFDFLAGLDERYGAWQKDQEVREMIAPKIDQAALSESRDFIVDRLRTEASPQMAPWITKNERGVPELPCPSCERQGSALPVYNETELEFGLARQGDLRKRLAGGECIDCRQGFPLHPRGW